ncbi:MAG: Rrf2 family transcriptional regulator [Victivallales bacterium]|nr:Rrf2 family transcriptional regulator [Victivallales bacterium]
MKLSTKPRYGLRILAEIALAGREGGKTASGKSIAENQNISEGYLEQLMIPLKRAGVVGTVRGCAGGYKLLRNEKKITVIEIIEIFEGEVTLTQCSKQCEESEWILKCPTKKVWSRLASSFKREAAKITLKEIVEDYEPKAKAGCTRTPKDTSVSD